MIRRLAACALALLVCTTLAPAEEPFHRLPFADAAALARTEKKVVFIDFFTTWCGPCKRLDAVTWKDEGVQRWLREKTVALKLDAEREVVLARRYQVRSYPTLLILTPDGQTHHSIASDGNLSKAIDIGHKAGQAVRDRAGPGFFEGWS